jgi:uncharacterized membrane protein
VINAVRIATSAVAVSKKKNNKEAVMWILCTVVGLFLGAMFESFSGAIALAALGAGLGAFLQARGFTLSPKKQNQHQLDEVLSDGVSTRASVSAMQTRLAALERRVKELEHAGAGAGAGADAATATAPAAGSPAEKSLGFVATADAPSTPERVPAAAAAVATPTSAIPVASALTAKLSVGVDTALPKTVPDVVALPPAPAPRKPLPPPPPAPPPTPSVPLRERLPAPLAKLIFGGNMLVKLGVLILFLGLSFLLRYTAERVTVPIELRYASVAAVGALLLALGWWLRNKRAAYGLILQGAGIGVFYLTTLGAMKMHALIDPTAGFAFLFVVAVLSAVLAVAQNAPALAIISVLEGFAAPVLASTGSNRPVGLFTYLLVLDVGVFVIAWFKAWRVLNLMALVGTFTLAAAWAERHYTDAQFAVVQPYLVGFFVLFAGIGVLFARRTLFEAPSNESLPLAQRASDTLRRVGRVDSSLVFGAPLAAFGLQYLLMRPWEFGAAFSALGFSAFYLVLGRFVFATQPRGLALLAEAYAIVGVIFATLSIPLGLEGQWTSATWAVEAAGMYWLGVRQARPYARGFAFLLLIGSAAQLLRSTTVVDAPGGPLLHGSFIGPMLMAASVFAMWLLWRRAKLEEGGSWEALAGRVLPWLGMAALVLLPWQWLTPMWAAAATALLALAAFAVSTQPGLKTLRPVVMAMQALAIISFMATLHSGANSVNAMDATQGTAALGNGWQGMLAAALIGLSVLATTAWTMRQAHLAALATGLRPQWPLAQSVALLAGVALLHLAMLFGVDLKQAALIWPFTATVALWVALRIGHAPLGGLGGALQFASAVLYFFVWNPRSDAWAAERAAFAHLHFWTPLALGVTGLVMGDFLRAEARHAANAGLGERDLARSEKPGVSRWVNAWCARPVILWGPVVWGLWWWLDALLGESSRVLKTSIYAANYQPAAAVAIVVLTSALALTVARRRDWKQLGQATLATVPGLAVVALLALESHGQHFLPSTDLGWLAWPLALVWHFVLLRVQPRWVSAHVLDFFHVAGLWLFLLLGARECQAQLGQLGRSGRLAEAYSSWSMLGWVLVPVLLLWLLRSRALLTRWPLNAHRRAYLEWALAPVAAYLLLWCWASNVLSAGDAAPLPFVTMLNPLELAHWLVLAALLLWCKAVQGGSTLALKTSLVKGVASVTAWALVTGAVLRACHHYANVPWRSDALYASWLAQAALSITWALCGVGAMVWGHKRGSRVVWLGGAVLIGVVVLKLFFVELANQGGLFRIVSFIGVGALLLLVGYFAPVPPAKPALREGVST